ncbi:unnamed protein product [Protopolystoma xenopodis]|uniref:Uncharacterized protein n=1 Tax=Protopolystoma xenopodis TaxID=117903 RepID=A0A3S5A1X3_9PLAT|nr:unnamed protein product [Protopolystoma xenopodis]
MDDLVELTLSEILSYSSCLGPCLGTFSDVSPASSVRLATLSTKLQLAKQTSEVNPLTNFLPKWPNYLTHALSQRLTYLYLSSKGLPFLVSSPWRRTRASNPDLPHGPVDQSLILLVDRFHLVPVPVYV